MKLLLSTDTIGGVWTYSLELARALEAHDVDVGLACLGASLTASQRAEVIRLPNVTLFENPFALEWMNDPWADVDAAGDWLLGIADQFRADIVQLCSYSHAAFEWNAPVVLVAHSCVYSWWRAVHGGAPPRQWHEYHRRVCAGLANADLVVAPTHGMLAVLGQHYLAPRMSVVIPNARAPQRFRPRTKLPVVLSVGRLWDEGKNIGALARVAATLRWPVLVAGDARSPDGTISTFENVRVMGRLAEQQLSAWLGSAGIYALPAFYEPFGLSVLEAALSRCPLVLGDIPTLRENWQDAALFVPPADDAALREALTSLIGDGRLRSNLAQRAYERAGSFSPPLQARRYYDEYRRLHAKRAADLVGEAACV